MRRIHAELDEPLGQVAAGASGSGRGGRRRHPERAEDVGLDVIGEGRLVGEEEGGELAGDAVRCVSDDRIEGVDKL